jgi:hypothetical protein
MSRVEPDWLEAGQGERPALAWSIALDAPLAGLAFAGESSELLAVDTSGGLYLLDRHGRVKTLTRGFKSLTALAWSDTGRNGAVATGRSKLSWFDHKLSVKWSVGMPAEILCLAVDPHGHYIAVSLSNSETVFFNARKQEVGRFKTIRPLRYLHFNAVRPVILGAAEYGLMCCHRLDTQGTEVWSERLWSNVGDMTVTGDGRQIYLARFNQGVQILDRRGKSNGSYLVQGTPSHVSTSFVHNRLGVATVERDIYWLDAEGELIWATHLPDDISGILADAQGTGMACGLRSGRIYRLEWPTY